MPPSSTFVRHVHVAGPLAPFATDLAAALQAAGYTPGSAASQLLLLNHLSRWLAAQHLAISDLTDAQVAAFYAERRARGCTWLLTPRSLAPLLALLETQGVRPALPSAPSLAAADALLASFERYLLQERGITPQTATAYVTRARRFLAGRPHPHHLAALTTADVTSAILAEAERVSVGATQVFIAALRAFLRFLHQAGSIGTDLAGAALAITGRRRSLLPAGLEPADATALLRTCEARTPVGRRDAAILQLLLRLGLRATEVATLRLVDLDWRAGELVVHGKGRTASRLPLPADVGAALAAWLQHGRPRTQRPEVFVSVQAPIRPIGRGAISSVVRRACCRAGLPSVGAHRLRHTAAGALLRAGVPLRTVSQVLRHQSLGSTAIYARVDLDGLRPLAQPWPEETGR